MRNISRITVLFCIIEIIQIICEIVLLRGQKILRLKFINFHLFRSNKAGFTYVHIAGIYKKHPLFYLPLGSNKPDISILN